MITTDIVIDKVKGNGPMPADLRLSKIEPATQDRRSELRKHRIFQLKCKTYNIESDTLSDSCIIGRLAFFRSNPLRYSIFNQNSATALLRNRMK